MRIYNIYIVLFFVFILFLGFVKTTVGQENSAIFISEQTYTKDSLDNFKGEIKYYKHQDFPKLKYSKPDIQKWLKNLKRINKPSKNIRYIAVASANKKPKYIRIIIDTLTFRKEICSILNDTIKFEASGLIVSAPNYQLYIYKNNLLNKHTLYMGCSLGKNTNYKLNFCPYREETFEYFKGTNKIKFVTTKYINKFADSEQNSKTEYNKSGIQITKMKIK